MFQKGEIDQNPLNPIHSKIIIHPTIWLIKTLLTQFIVRSSFIQPFGVAATITPDNDLSSFFTFLARTTTQGVILVSSAFTAKHTVS